MSKKLLTILLCCLTVSAYAGSRQYKAYKQGRKLIKAAIRQLNADSKAHAFSFTQSNQQFAHLYHPWQTLQYDIHGTYMLGAAHNSLFITDTMVYNKQPYAAYKWYNDSTLLIKDYGEEELSKVTVNAHHDYLYSTYIYSPLMLLRHVLQLPVYNFSHVAYGYNDTITCSDGDKILSIIIDPDKRVAAIECMYPDDLYGDVVNTVHYDNYTPYSGGYYPAHITEREHDITLNDLQITYRPQPFDTTVITKLMPANYKLTEDTKDTTREITYTKYNDHIHLLELHHTDDRVMIVEFKDYLLVEGAPLSTENGQLIIDKIKALIPGKPIKYFTFGHFHPHYTGGMRAFVHEGATILAQPQDTAYMRQLATFPHRLKPDVLQLDHKVLKLETYDGDKIISDGTVTMRIIPIGNLSKHTDDYALFYFPDDKLLFEDDLVWIRDDKPISAASTRQMSVYNAIEKNNLSVDTIIQSWPVKSMHVKTIIPYSDLKTSAELAQKK